ncbi:hypothetical protein BCON_0352g00020 [Botryotinia convoluta]|uniref:NADP-dependent oxidoreductase domain-containing protein n=1 Tax=Botryotinia convoluta TaxID=54673 RepID=A0A4Z1HM21_9HELO|nr:hypothetical protein BCON_0352g00020 [Botryotinia convoluta]
MSTRSRFKGSSGVFLYQAVPRRYRLAHQRNRVAILKWTEEVGVAIKESGIPREVIFVTAKVFEGLDDMPPSIQNSLTKFQLDYVDLIQVASFNGSTPITKARPGPLGDILAEIAARRQVPENAILISWQITQNFVVTTTTTKVGRLEDYVAVVRLNLSREEQEKITQVGLMPYFRAWVPDRFDLNNRF